jgi:hypothetical protein
MTTETFFLGAFLTAWVVGFVLGSKFRMFKQAAEAIS